MLKKIHNNPDGLTMALLVALGILIVLIAFLAMFSVQGHETVLVVLFILGVGLVLVGALLPKIEDILEIGPKGIKLKLRRLNKEVKKAESQVPSASSSARKDDQNYSTEEITEQILEEAAKSPLSAFIHLSEIIERRFRILLAVTNWLRPSPGMNFTAVIDFVTERKFVAVSLSSSLKTFWSLRNSIVHGTGDEDVVRAIDMGISILKMIDGIPHEKNIVFHPGVRVYQDPECKLPIENVLGLILDTQSPGGVVHDKRIFPTRQVYEVGQELSWEWGFGDTWRDAWYKDPETGEIKLAWNSSAEFTGRPLNSI